MIKHIIRLIWNQRKSNGWLLGELFLVSVCLWYVVDYFLATGLTFQAPVGFDIAHTYKFHFNMREEGAEGFVRPDEHPAPVGQDVWDVLNRLKSDPAIEAVAVSQYSLPYTRIFNAVSLSPDTLSSDVNMRVYYVGPGYFDVFRIRSARENGNDLGKGQENGAIVLSEDAAKLLGNGSPFDVSTVRVNNSYAVSVGGISEPTRSDEFQCVAPCVYFPITEANIKAFTGEQLPWVEISVRVKPAADVDFADLFMKEKSGRLEVGNLYLQNIVPLSSIRADTLRENMNRMNARLSLLFFLLVNIFLGVVGTFWFRTRQRQGEIGLRMALGSTRSQLRKILFAEGFLLLSIAFLAALVVCANIAYAGLTDTSVLDHTFWRFVAGAGIAYLLMAGMIAAGIWYPAREISRVEPATALHYE